MITKTATSKILVKTETIYPDALSFTLGRLLEDHLRCADLAVMMLHQAFQEANK